MAAVARPRHYVSPVLLVLLRPVFRYSPHRSAYVLRLIGDRHGPVLRENRRRRQREFDGFDRRRAGVRVGDERAVVGR
jgi:hypothetical protein